jgi:CRISPR system Cascade subunit CasE
MITLYLTQLIIPHIDVVARLRICDSYGWHKRIWDLFDKRDGQVRDFLFRAEQQNDSVRVLVQSQSPTTCPDWYPNSCFKAKQIPETFFKHTHYRFSLLANPTKKVARKRVPLSAPENLATWIERKAHAGGFIVREDSLTIIPRPRQSFYRSNARGTHTAVEFQGILSVTDHEQFRATVANGIGSAKAFGFGLICLSTINSIN